MDFGLQRQVEQLEIPPPPEMAAKKAVLFDLWGCVQNPRLHHIFRKYEESLGLPR